MTSITTASDALLGRIHETGYWRILLHPTVFEERRIPTLRACEELIDASKVRLRVWDYPHFEPASRTTIRGDDWLQCSTDFANYVELWRLYQSGQFVHQFGVRQDRLPPTPTTSAGRAGDVIQQPRFLDFVEVIFTLTEILEFTRSLAYRGVLDPDVSLRIELHGMQDRMLVSPRRFVHEYYIASCDDIAWTCTEPAPVVIADAPQLAIDAAMHIFERFNWPDPPRAVFEEDQRRFLERRL
ncbi:MAG: hypothetical protein ACYDCQ_12220 [Dehalococcoidia bacterium]